MTHKFELGRDFCTVHLATKFHRPTFNRSEVIVSTNKSTNKQSDDAENFHPQTRFAMLRRWVIIYAACTTISK